MHFSHWHCMVLLIAFIYLNKVDGEKKRILMNNLDQANLQQQVRDMEAKLINMERLVNDLSSKGRRFMYTGEAGLALIITLSYTQVRGAGANPLCLTHEPIWGVNHPPEGNRDILHGAEYQDAFWGSNKENQDVPCAVCESHNGKHTIMIPGRNKCIKGWTEEYHGYLASNHRGYARAGYYICVDQVADVLDSGNRADFGYCLFGVSTKCGSLQCPPYEDNKSVTCVVCTK